jgi:N-acetylneuraminic acid mutarotase
MTVIAPIIVNENLPLDSRNINGVKLVYRDLYHLAGTTDAPGTVNTLQVGACFPLEDGATASINPIIPGSEIQFNNFVAGFSYNPRPFGVLTGSTVSSLNISEDLGRTIELNDYTSIDLNVSGGLVTIDEGTDYSISKVTTANANTNGIISAFTNLPLSLRNFETITLGDYIYVVGGEYNAFAYYVATALTTAPVNGDIFNFTVGGVTVPMIIGNNLFYTVNKLGAYFSTATAFSSIPTKVTLSGSTTSIAILPGAYYLNVSPYTTPINPVDGDIYDFLVGTSVIPLTIGTDLTFGINDSGPYFTTSYVFAQTPTSVSLSSNTTNVPTGLTPGNIQLNTISDLVFQFFINNNNILSQPVTLVNTLPQALKTGYLTQLGNSLFYVAGMSNNGVIANVYSCPIHSDNTLGAWVDTGVPLPLAGSQLVACTVNGVIYVISLYPGPKPTTGTPLTGMVYYSTTLNSSNALNAWTPGANNLFANITTISAFYYGGKVVVMGSNIYILGGIDYNNVNYQSVFSVYITSTGTLNSVVDTFNSLPMMMFDFSVLLFNTNMYLFGGYNPGGVAQNTKQGIPPYWYSSYYTWIAPVAGDTIGPWSAFWANMPAPLSGCKAIVNNDILYLLGGETVAQNQSPTLQNPSNYIYEYPTAIYRSDLLLQTFIDWHTPSALPAPVADHTILQIGNYLYSFGGKTGGNIAFNAGTGTNSIYYCPIDAKGILGQWETSGIQLPVQGWGFSLIIISTSTANNLYLIGGYTSAGPISTVYMSTINPDNTITPFLPTYSLPNPIAEASVYYGGNTLYAIAGYDGNYGSSLIYTAPVDSSGQIGPWVTSTDSLPLGIMNTAPLVIGNTLFVFGNASAVPANNIYYSAPINADGSLGTFNSKQNPVPVGSVGISVNYANSTVYVLGSNNASGTGYDIYTAPYSNGVIGANWTPIHTDLPYDLYGQQSIILGNQLIVIGGTDNNMFYNTISTYILNFQESYVVNLVKPLAAVPSNIYLTQNLSATGLIASGGYLEPLVINTVSFVNGTFTYSYNPIYYANNGDNIFFQMDNLNKGDVLLSFTGIGTGTETIPGSGVN